MKKQKQTDYRKTVKEDEYLEKYLNLVRESKKLLDMMVIVRTIVVWVSRKSSQEPSKETRWT